MKDSAKEKKESLGMVTPLSTDGMESIGSTPTRRNKSSVNHRLDRFKNIEDGILPFNRQGAAYTNTSNLNVRDAIVLCQKAYYNVAIFRNTIDLMSEFSAGKIFLSGGTKKSRRFFEGLLRKLNISNFQDQFFREYYRSGNVVIHRHDSELKETDVRKLSKEFGHFSIAESLRLPAKYIVLNPADIEVAGSVSFISPSFFQRLTKYDIHILKNPSTDAEWEIREALPKDVRDQIDKKGGFSSEIMLPLDPSKVRSVFYKKQDYEPLAIPMGFGVLEDINYKKELKKMDMALARTIQQVVLLVTVGSELKDGTLNVNQKHLSALQEVFKNESVARVLVSDYTTKAEFVIPQIGDILDPKKYEVVDRDILKGLNNILLGEDKFSSSNVKARVFVARLEQARQSFVDDFLQPEMNRISKEMGFKGAPIAKLEKIDLDDQSEKDRLIARLGELGILTPDEVLVAVQNGIFPTPEESRESQINFKGLKDEGLYAPAQQGGGMQQSADRGGRPKNGGSEATASYGLSKFAENLKAFGLLEIKVKAAFKKARKIRRMGKIHNDLCEVVAENICKNYPVENWEEESKILKTIESPYLDSNPSRVELINEFSASHNEAPSLSMAILFASELPKNK